MIKKLYNKSIEWAAHKSSKAILAFVSFIESFIKSLLKKDDKK